MDRAFKLLAASLLLGACGALETPTAVLAGRIAGASEGAYAYPLGRPDLKVGLEDDGSFRIDGLPTSVEAVVLFDGVDRAELVAVDLRGGHTARVSDRAAATMPLAGSAVIVARPAGGAIPHAPAFTVEGTDHGLLESDVADDGVATIYPLPAGRFELRVEHPGFRAGRRALDVGSGATTLAEVELEIDAAVAAPGCNASSGCEHDLSCAPDGHCLACVVDADCGSGELCDVAVGLCRPASGPAPTVCAACALDSDCSSGACVIAGGESKGYCSLACASAADCPAGFACGASGRCEAPKGCDDWLRTMAETCTEDAHCAEALAGGHCERTGDAPGFCTASCTTDAQCQVGTFTPAKIACGAGSICQAP